MNKITKKEIQENITKCRVQQLIEADIRKVIEEFKRFKKVNKKFTDRLEGLGYHAYISREHSDKLHVSNSQGRVEIYKYGCFLTWENIIESLNSQDYKGSEEYWTLRLEAYDSDIEKLEGLRTYIKELGLVCFDTFRMVREIEICLYNYEKSKDW